jgi:drug/metabolite transporter (DMT)-like permease
LTSFGSSAKNLNEKSSSNASFLPAALGFLLLPLTGIKRVRRQLRQTPLMLVLAVLSMGAVLGLSGCGSHSNPPQSYTIVVTATDSTTGAHNSTNLTLTVQ